MRQRGKADMPVATRRVFRLNFTVALSLVIGYGLGLDMPYLVPIFAVLLASNPAPPMPPKRLLVLVIAVMIILGAGLLLSPMLVYYPLSAVLIVCCGIYLSSYLSVNMGQGPLASFLMIALTLISAVGTQSWAAASSLIDAVAVGLFIAIVCHWLIYPFFPEDADSVVPEAPQPTLSESNWIAVRATVIIMPVFLLTLTNPTMYAPIVMKSVSLGQQVSMVSARDAGKELLGSTFLGGCFAILIWFALGISTNLWFFFLWMLLFGVYYGGKLYQVFPSRYPASFWSNVVVTTLILLGSAVQDSETGKDVYKAFAVRMGLFLAVTCYAWGTMYALERWFERSRARLRLRVLSEGG